MGEVEMTTKKELEQEIAKLKAEHKKSIEKFGKIVADCIINDEEREKRLRQIRKLIHIGKLAPTCGKHPTIEFCKQCKECEVGQELVGLLKE